MQLIHEDIELRSDDATLLAPWLERVGGRILELGCGDGRVARTIASHPSVDSVLALEVDPIQHDKNLAAPASAKLRFGLGGAESIDAEDQSFDMVMMFKSLHHVPIEAMDQALAQLHRVLRPGGIAYLSEPVFAGRFNEILALFHDESEVRRLAFEAIERAVEAGHFELVEERFFLLPTSFPSFVDFEQRVIGVTHTQHRLDEETLRLVKARFAFHHGVNGGDFLAPQRIDVLRRRP